MSRKSAKVAKVKPEWMRKIDAENLAVANHRFQARCAFIEAKLDFELMIDDLNDKWGTNYTIFDIFGITQEEEQQALDMMEGADDDDDED